MRCERRLRRFPDSAVFLPGSGQVSVSMEAGAERKQLIVGDPVYLDPSFNDEGLACQYPTVMGVASACNLRAGCQNAIHLPGWFRELLVAHHKIAKNIG